MEPKLLGDSILIYEWFKLHKKFLLLNHSDLKKIKLKLYRLSIKNDKDSLRKYILSLSLLLSIMIEIIFLYLFNCRKQFTLSTR